jgi:hypothetical protein
MIGSLTFSGFPMVILIDGSMPGKRKAEPEIGLSERRVWDSSNGLRLTPLSDGREALWKLVLLIVLI